MSAPALEAAWVEGRVARLALDGSLYWDLAVDVPDLPAAAPGQFAMLAPGSGLGARRSAAAPAAVDPARRARAPALSLQGLRPRHAGLTELKPGDPLRILAPLGRPFGVEASPHPFLLGGGVGIPPLHWLSRHLSEQAIAHRVVFGFNTAAEMPSALLAELEQELEVCTVDGSQGARGNPVDFLRGVQDHAHMRVQACGPTPMLAALKRAVRPGDLLELSLEERMACGVGICRGCVVPVKDGEDWRMATVCREGPVFDAAALMEVDGV